ncbi:GNAT family N-acetyltransferase [Kribbella sp. NPDC050241]|uniref:GNAT family N-acetyltransferase n=1 Tax=Kribbella sp. NPDC050241 TaxID=3364115 RepID=UPI00378AE9C3
MPDPLVPVEGIRLLDGADAVPLAEQVWLCYDEVFGDSADFDTWRSDLFERHAARDAYRLAIVADGGRIVGFSWGYVGQRGQYWSDLVYEALPREVADDWVGNHFEIVELAVRPSHRRRGLGQALHDRILEGVDRRCLLSTSADEEAPAVRLYLSSGWRPLGTLRPGVQVMGRHQT